LPENCYFWQVKRQPIRPKQNDLFSAIIALILIAFSFAQGEELSVADSLEKVQEDMLLKPIDLEKIPPFQIDDAEKAAINEAADSSMIDNPSADSSKAVQYQKDELAPPDSTLMLKESIADSAQQIDTLKAFADLDTVAAAMPPEADLNMKSIEDSLKQIIQQVLIDSLDALYEEKIQLKLAREKILVSDSLQQLFRNKSDTLLNSLRDKKFSAEAENRHFQYILTLRKALEAEEVRGSKSRMELAAFIYKEYQAYLAAFFPNGHSSAVLAELARFYILQDKGEIAKLICLKNLIFLPDSPYYQSELQQMKKLMPAPEQRSDEDILFLQAADRDEKPSLHPAEKYLQALTQLHQFPHLEFLKEEFLTIHGKYYEQLQYGDRLLKDFQSLLSRRDAASSALMISKRLEYLYPQSPILAEMLFQNILLSRDNLRDYEAAIRQAEDFIARFPAHHKAAEAQLLIGRISIQNLRQKLKALEAYRKVTERYAGTAQAAEAHFARAEIYLRSSRNFEPALEEYEAIASRYSRFEKSALEALKQKCLLYEKEGSFEKAIGACDRIAALGYNEDEAAAALLKSGQIAESKLKDLPQARQRYEKFLKENPKHRQAGTIQKKVQTIEKKLEKSKKD
jgi:tetratricopeptide (TPR) repeat protein